MRYTIGWKEYGGEWCEYATDSLPRALYKFVWALWRFPMVDMAYRDDAV